MKYLARSLSRNPDDWRRHGLMVHQVDAAGRLACCQHTNLDDPKWLRVGESELAQANYVYWCKRCWPPE